MKPDKEAVQQFLLELTELTMKHGIRLKGKFLLVSMLSWGGKYVLKDDK